MAPVEETAESNCSGVAVEVTVVPAPSVVVPKTLNKELLPALKVPPPVITIVPRGEKEDEVWVSVPLDLMI